MGNSKSQEADEKIINQAIQRGNSKSQEADDIIIKCSVEEIIKLFFKEYVIVWYDPNVDSEENQKYLDQLRKFYAVTTFTKWDKASAYILDAKETCHVVTSGTNGEVFVNEISSRDNVLKIYIFCRNKEYHSTWAKGYDKVCCIEVLIQDIMFQIEQNLHKWFQEVSSFRRNLPAFAPFFNDYDKSHMNNLHRYLKVIPSFENRLQAKNDFLALSKAVYRDEKDAPLLKCFEKDYNDYKMEQALHWYTRESFLYKAVNNCLRIASSDSIQYCRLLLKDIEMAIQEQYRAQSKNFSGLLYRGAYLSEGEWSSLKENRGKEIEMHGFLSVSKLQNVALDFIKTDPSQKVLITIIVPRGPNEAEQGFAEVERFSQYPAEKEILFNVRSRFTVLETEDQYSEELSCRHLVLFYGAQGFRRYTTEQNPVQEVLIHNDISCGICSSEIQKTLEKTFFISFAKDTENKTFICKTCLDKYLETINDPLLCVAIKDGTYQMKMKGFRLNYPTRRDLEIPFYGYICKGCQLKKQKFYFKCTECNEGKETFCRECFGNISRCVEVEHGVVLESHPFSFWCETMPEKELNHLEFQQEIISNGNHIFKQAQMYSKSQQYQKAKEYYKLYLQQNEEKDQNSNLTICYSNLGAIYNDLGKYNKALEYHSKSLEIDKSVHGDNHPDTATSYSHIGIIYRNLGEYKKALEYHSKSLEIYKAVYGDNHTETATSYSHIGLTYDKQGEYNKALECHFKSLEIYKSVYGDNHPHTATSYNNIGSIYHNLREYNKALEYHTKSLVIKKSVYGDNHTETATSYSHIGSTYDKQGEYNKALECYSKSLEIAKSVYGDNHPHTATSYNNIGVIYHNLREYNKALEYYFKSLEIAKSVHGDNHPHTASSYNNIGVIYGDLGEYNKVLECYSKSLEIAKSVYGDNHPHTATSYNNIGVIYRNLGEYKKALEYHSKSLEIRKSVYGDNHSETADSYQSIGSIYKNQKDFKKAVEFYSKSLEIYKSSYGENHPKVIAVKDELQNIISS